MRHIARLRCLLLDRTPLHEDAVQRLGLVLVDLAARAAEWGARKGIGPVAVVHYRREDEAFVLMLRDESGWFADDPPRASEGLGGVIARGRFDEVAIDEPSRQVVMTLAMPPGP